MNYRWLLLGIPLFALALFAACSNGDSGGGDIATLTGAAAQTATPDATSGALAQHMAEAVADGFSGTVLVARGDDVLLHQGYGECIREEGVACGPDTAYDIGSITKVFTAATVMALVEQGLMSVDDTIETFFIHAPPDKAQITVEQLLTHTAGFPEILGADYDEVDRQQFLDLAFAAPLEYEPGAGYGYSNVGYSILGAALEAVVGPSYEAVLKDTVLDPAGMTATGYLLPDWSSHDVAHGYTGEQAFGSPLDHEWSDDGPYWHLRANGGLLSTADDLLAFHNALPGDDVLSEDTLAAMYTPYADDQGIGRGYGWGVEETGVGTVVRHNGGNGFFFADFLRYLDQDLVVIVLSNTWDYPDRAMLAEALGDIVLGIG